MYVQCMLVVGFLLKLDKQVHIQYKKPTCFIEVNLLLKITI